MIEHPKNQELLRKLLRQALDVNVKFRMCQQCCTVTMVHRLGTRLFCAKCVVAAFQEAGLDVASLPPIELTPFVKGVDVWVKFSHSDGDVWEPGCIGYRNARGCGVRFLAGSNGFVKTKDLLLREPGQVVFSPKMLAKAV